MAGLSAGYSFLSKLSLDLMAGFALLLVSEIEQLHFIS